MAPKKLKREGPEKAPVAERDPQTEKQGDLIGQNLRRVYEDVASEPLPDRFTDLLKQLKSKSEK